VVVCASVKYLKVKYLERKKVFLPKLDKQKEVQEIFSSSKNLEQIIITEKVFGVICAKKSFAYEL